MTTSTDGRRITRDDLEHAFSRLVGEGEQAAGRAVPAAIVVAGAIAAVTLAAVFLAGKRRGRRRSSVIEIRRI